MRRVTAARSTCIVLALAILLTIPARSALAGGGRERETPEERLARAAALIEQRQFDDSVEDIASAVEDDEEYVERAEELFRRIRDARQEWLEIGDEVLDNLARLRDPELPQSEILPAAVDTLASVRQMDAVYPNPNPEDAEIINDLNARVSLTVDQQRFRLVAEQAAAALEAGDYVTAVQFYVDGVEEDFGDLTEEQQALVTQETGIDLQRGVFESRPASLSDELLASARESIRELAVGDPEDLPEPFVSLAPVAQEEVAVLNATFAAGEFENADQLIADYLPTLRTVLDLSQAVREAAAVIETQEALNAQRLLEDPDYEYDWHTRFVSDLVLGRLTLDGESGSDEGLLYAVEQVRSIVLDGPADVTTEFASTNYQDAVALLTGFPWQERTSPADDDQARTHVAEVLPLLGRVQTAALTAVEIINAADELGLEIAQTDALAGPALAAYAPVLDARTLIGEQSRETLLGQATVLLASSLDLGSAVQTFETAFRAATPLASESDRTLLAGQRTDLQAPLSELEQLRDSWETVPDALEAAYATQHASYVGSLVSLAQSYETDVAARIARIDVAELQRRRATLQQSVDSADSNLSRTEVLDGTSIEVARPLSGAARDSLLPLVGTTSGTEVTDALTGELAQLRQDALALASSLESDVVHVSTDPRVESEEQAAREIAAAIGGVNAGILGRAVELLELALERVAVAQESESAGRGVIAEIQDLVLEASAASENGLTTRASELLGDAQQLLSSDNPAVVDAGDLFQTSLANWYRPDVEEFWNSQQVVLNNSVVEAQQSIVFVEVDQLSAQAQEALSEQDYADALGILEQAENIWSNVFPTTVNRTLTALLRQARTGFDQEASRVLREDMPGYTRLSRTLTNAYIAYDDGAYDEARAALTVFFNEQPLNFEARLLEVRLELASAQGNASTVVNSLIDGAIEAVDLTTIRLQQIDPYLISNAEATAALELEARLIAIREVVEDTGTDAGQAADRISNLLSLTDQVLRPPAIVPDPPVNLRAEADELIARAEAYGDWATLPGSEQQEVLALLERALQLVPGYSPAVQRWQQLVALVGGRQTLPAAGQAVLEEAITLRNQRQIADALTVMEDYLDVNPNAVLNKEFNDLLAQLQAAQRGR